MENIKNDLLQRFRPPAFPGSYFISFEGIEGAGKSTQIKNIMTYLEKMDFRVLLLREPGGTIFGEKLRKAILDTQTDLHPLAEAHLFASARAEMIHKVILKEMEVPGTIIISDRYIDSSLAYQGMARGLGFETILNIHQHFPLSLVPHLTLYFKIDLKTSMERQKTRNAPKDYFEAQGIDFYNNLIAGYEKSLELFPHRIKCINAIVSQEEITEEVKLIIDQLILQPTDIQEG
ncbi:MAG: dTMP kinase [Bacteriovoracaceae bacterium]|jgi:dTMP kinase|nr:dTMP kinase [Bacteriovoracaceae bacterium]